jgi:hypothetical protein
MATNSSHGGAHFASSGSEDKPKKSTNESAARRSNSNSSENQAMAARSVKQPVYLPQEKPPKRHHAGRVILIIVLVIVALVGAFGYALYHSAKIVANDASTIQSTTSSLVSSLESGDTSTLKSSTDTIVTAAEEMHAETSNNLWAIASHLPYVGQDVSNVIELSDISYDLCNNALRPLSSSLSGFSLNSLISDGHIDVESLQSLADAISEVAPEIDDATTRADALQDGNIEQVNEVISKVKTQLDSVNGGVQGLAEVAPSIPALFGANGETRTYLLVAQNNSELRAAGGLPGSRMTLSVTDGHLELGESVSLSTGSTVDLALQDDETEMLGTAGGVSAAWSTYTPNFERAGELVAQGWEQAGYEAVDGVIAVDPVFLQRLLALTGGITTSDGTTVDGTNAAEVLMSDIYWEYGSSGDLQDEVFAEVAGLAFDKLMSSLGEVDIQDLLDVITTSAGDYRLQVWMADDQEEEVMRKLGLSGSISDDSSQPVLGIYLNDNTIAKIDWYLQVSSTIDGVVTNEDGTKTYTVTTSFTNTLTEEEAASAPQYVSGYSTEKNDTGDMILIPTIMAPAGGSISGLENGAKVGTLYGLDTRNFIIHLEPQQTVSYTYEVTCAAGAADLQVRMTPLAQESLMSSW